MLLLVMLLALLYSAGPYLEKNYHDYFVRFVSTIVHQPVQIGEITLGSRGLEPILRLGDVIIFNNAKTKQLVKVRELQVGIDLIGSLFKWQIKPGLLLVRGSEFSVYQNKTGKIGILGIAAKVNDPSISHINIFNEITPWVLEQSKFKLEDINLKWRLATGELIKLQRLNLSLDNGVLQHELKMQGSLEQKDYPATFKADFKFRKDFSAETIPAITGNITLENWSSELTHLPFPRKQFLGPKTGEINFLIKQARIATGFLRKPLTISSVSGRVGWHQEAEGLKVNISKLEFMDDWLTFYGGSQLLFVPEERMPIVNIQLGFKLANLARAKLYYPVTLLPKDSVAWLDQAFIASKPILGNMVLVGPLAKFPFDHNEGKFAVISQLQDVHLNYDKEWPSIKNINGKMIFTNRSMLILARSAKILNKSTRLIEARIPDLENPILQIAGTINDDASTGLQFIRLSPLKDVVGRKLRNISLSGPMKFDLKMVMPLSADSLEKNTRVEGDIVLDNNVLRTTDLNLSINDLTGRLHFVDGNLMAENVKGKLFNYPVKLNVHTLNPNSKDPVTQINIIGSATVKNFEQAFAISLDPYLTGEFNYSSLLELHSLAKSNTFKLNSNLYGIKIDLPSPFNKTAMDKSRLDLTCYFGDNKLSELKINYNNQINAALLIKKNPANTLAIQAGEIKFGAKPAANITTSQGLVIMGDFVKLDWSLWQSYLYKTKASFAKLSSVLRQINLNVTEFHILGQIFKQVTFRAQPKEDGWQVAILMANVDGTLFLPNATKASIRGEFKKLYIDSEQQILTKIKPQDLPPLSFVIEELHYGAKNFNKVKFTTLQQPDGLKINQMSITGPKFNIEANGEWMAVKDKQHTVFRGTINSSDMGGLLKQWDLTNNVVAGEGSANFVLNWPFAPYAVTLPALSGSFALRISKGRIINLGHKTESKLNFGRVLSMLSLQALPRRLALDFSDLTQQGFSFDTMKGKLELSNGNLLVKKLTLDGELAYIRAYGRIGLKTYDYDLMLSAMLAIPTGLPLATTATVLGGPVAGVLSLVVDKAISSLTKKIAKKTANYNYHITGTWDKPYIDKK